MRNLFVLLRLLLPALLMASDLNVIQKTDWEPLEKSYGYLLQDPLSIIENEPHHWRREDFELYSWSSLPGILIIDTRDYAIQANLFKRLAFFVEKTGWQGKIPPWDSLHDRHSYNAHNYRAEDLARFFNQALPSELTPGENLLREILVRSGVMGGGTRRYYPVGGGILSLSQESTPRLRKKLMVHEMLHAVFYRYADYRENVFTIWERLSVDEKSIWYLFLYSRDYHGDDTYLAVNEFQAYLLQQSEPAWQVYFSDVVVPGIRADLPMEWVYLIPFLTANDKPFGSSREALAAALSQTAVSQAGIDLVDLITALTD